MIHKALSFFRDYAGEKWPLRGSKHADSLISQIIGVRFRVSGVRCQEGGLLNPET